MSDINDIRRQLVEDEANCTDDRKKLPDEWLFDHLLSSIVHRRKLLEIIENALNEYRCSECSREMCEVCGQPIGERR